MHRRMLITALMTFVLATLSWSPAQGEDSPPPAVEQLFNSLRSSWRSGNADGIVQHIGERVRLYLDGQASDTFSRKQAPGVLRAYFGRTRIETMEHKEYKGSGSSWYEVVKYEYYPEGGGLVRGTLTLQLRQAEGRWILDTATVGR